MSVSTKGLNAHALPGKCDLCMDRLDAGLQPACVTACTTHALKLVRIE